MYQKYVQQVCKPIGVTAVLLTGWLSSSVAADELARYLDVQVENRCVSCQIQYADHSYVPAPLPVNYVEESPRNQNVSEAYMRFTDLHDVRAVPGPYLPGGTLHYRLYDNRISSQPLPFSVTWSHDPERGDVRCDAPKGLEPLEDFTTTNVLVDRYRDPNTGVYVCQVILSDPIELTVTVSNEVEMNLELIQNSSEPDPGIPLAEFEEGAYPPQVIPAMSASNAVVMGYQNGHEFMGGMRYYLKGSTHYVSFNWSTEPGQPRCSATIDDAQKQYAEQKELFLYSVIVDPNAPYDQCRFRLIHAVPDQEFTIGLWNRLDFPLIDYYEDETYIGSSFAEFDASRPPPSSLTPGWLDPYEFPVYYFNEEGLSGGHMRYGVRGTEDSMRFYWDVNAITGETGCRAEYIPPTPGGYPYSYLGTALGANRYCEFQIADNPPRQLSVVVDNRTNESLTLYGAPNLVTDYPTVTYLKPSFPSVIMPLYTVKDVVLYYHYYEPIFAIFAYEFDTHATMMAWKWRWDDAKKRLVCEIDAVYGERANEYRIGVDPISDQDPNVCWFTLEKIN